jgi:hypothetical protein
MYLLANRDLEISCDEAVVRSLGNERKNGYALSLLDLAYRNKRPSLASSFSKNALEERIKEIMKAKSISVRSYVLAGAFIVVVALVLGISFSSASADQSGPADIPDSLVELSKESAFVGAELLAKQYFETDSTVICVEVIDGEPSGSLQLFDINDESVVVQELALTADAPFAVFENLKPSTRYIIKPVDVELSCNLRITADLRLLGR